MKTATLIVGMGSALLCAAIAIPAFCQQHGDADIDVKVVPVTVAHTPVDDEPLLYSLYSSDMKVLATAVQSRDPKAKPFHVEVTYGPAEANILSPEAGSASSAAILRPGDVLPSGQSNPKTGKGYQVALAITGNAVGNCVPVVINYAISTGHTDGVVHGTLRTTVELGTSITVARDRNMVLTLFVG